MSGDDHLDEVALRAMPEYDRSAWNDLVDVRQRTLARNPRRIVPAPVRARLAKAGSSAVEATADFPYASEVSAALRRAAEGGSEGLARLANTSLSPAKVCDAYRSAGAEIAMLSDVRELELRLVDQVKPRIDRKYVATVGATGAGAGLLITGGEITALLGGAAGAAFGSRARGVGVAPGAGVGAAPGAATALSAMVGDALTTVLASTRAIFETALYYGYDTNAPHERIRALGVLNVATAGDAATKQAAYRELNKLTHLIVRNATWSQLDANVMGRILRQVLQQQAERVTKQKLSNLVPVAGVAIGAGFNMRMLSRVADTAEWTYRERFLRERYEIPTALAAESNSDDGARSILDIIEGELGNE